MHVESFNGKFRDKCLNTHWLTSLRQARNIIENWKGLQRRTASQARWGMQRWKEFARANSTFFAAATVNNTGAEPAQGNPDGLAALGLDPARNPREG